MTENNTLVINKTEQQTDLNNTVPEVDEFETHIMNYVSLLHPDDKLFLNFKNIYHDGNNYIKNINGRNTYHTKRKANLLINILLRKRITI